MNFHSPARETIKSAPALTTNGNKVTNLSPSSSSSSSSTGNTVSYGSTSSSSSSASPGLPTVIPAAREPVWSAPAVHGWYGVMNSSTTNMNGGVVSSVSSSSSSSSGSGPSSSLSAVRGSTNALTGTPNIPHQSTSQPYSISPSNNMVYVQSTHPPSSSSHHSSVSIPHGSTLRMNDPNITTYHSSPPPIYYSAPPNIPSPSSFSTHDPSSSSPINSNGYTTYSYQHPYPSNNVSSAHVSAAHVSNGPSSPTYYITTHPLPNDHPQLHHSHPPHPHQYPPQPSSFMTTKSTSSVMLVPSSTYETSEASIVTNDSSSTQNTNNHSTVTNIFAMLQHQAGCRTLQVELDKNNDSIKDSIFQEILPIACPIACSTFGNYVLQRLLNSLTSAQRTALVRVFVGQEPYGKDDPLASTYKASISSAALEYLRTWETSNATGNFSITTTNTVINANDTTTVTGTNSSSADASANNTGTVTGNSSNTAGTFPSFIRICMDVHGTRVIQRLLEIVSNTNDLHILLDTFTIHKGYISQLASDANANHIIQRLLMMEGSSSNIVTFRTEILIPLLIQDILFLSCQRHGAVVVQKGLEIMTDPQIRQSFIQSIVACAPEITDDPCGNFVVGHIFQHGSEDEVQSLITKLKGRWFAFAMQKCASNVVEKAIIRANDDQRQMIIEELCRRQTVTTNSMGMDTTGTSAFHMLLQSQYGNFVVQSAISAANNDQLQLLINHLRSLFPILPNTPGGRRIIQRLLRKQPDLEHTLPELQSIVQSLNSANGGGGNTSSSPHHQSFHQHNPNGNNHSHHTYPSSPNSHNYYPPTQGPYNNDNHYHYPPSHPSHNNYPYNGNHQYNSRPSSNHQNNRYPNNNHNNNNSNSSSNNNNNRHGTHSNDSSSPKSSSSSGFGGRFPFGWGNHSNNSKHNK